MMTPVISVLANSLPRGGPFLLGSALQCLGYRKYVKADTDNSPAAFNYLEARQALQQHPPQTGKDLIGISPFAPCYAEPALMAAWLSGVQRDEYIPAHIPWSPALPAVMPEVNCRHIVILRDPRALLLSLLFDSHPMPRFLIRPFAAMSAEAQLEFMLSGGAVAESEMTLQAFASVYRSMLKWQDCAGCLVVRYEDLSGPQGGGSQQQQWAALQQMAAFLDLPVLTRDTSTPARLATITDPSVGVFRTDQAAQWSDTVGEKLVKRVMHGCQALAEEAGYGELLLQDAQL
jgi:hypothetical protein